MLDDSLLASIADYARHYTVARPAVYESARCCLVESLSECFQALNEPACAKLLGPLVPGAVMPGGARVPGTSLELDPVHAAFNIGTLARWSDSGDGSGTNPWGHPADCLGAVLAVADYLARRAVMEGSPPPRMHTVLGAWVKAQEIQGSLALERGDAHTACDSLLWVRVASAAIATALLGGTSEHIVSAVSQAWIDGAPLPLDARHSRHGRRSRWAAGDAASRGVRLALLVIADPDGDRSALTHRGRGTGEVLCTGKPIRVPHPLGTRIVDERLGRRSAKERLQLLERFHSSVDGRFPSRQAERIKTLFTDLRRLDDQPVNELIAALVTNGAAA
jgi:2-methylcitrate dehydratase